MVNEEEAYENPILYPRWECCTRDERMVRSYTHEDMLEYDHKVKTNNLLFADSRSASQSSPKFLKYYLGLHYNLEPQVS
jgi:hypothetical protein